MCRTDLLREADARLPRDATVLLVTSARDIRRLGYITFHRALYMLAPRAVWWISPAPGDGTWESRWWLTAPATAETICAAAREKRANAALLYDVRIPPPSPSDDCPTWRIVDVAGGTLLILDPATALLATAPRRAEQPVAWWPLRLAAAVAVILSLGCAVITLIEMLGLRVSLAESLSLSWPLGAGLLTLGFALGSAFGVGLDAQLMVWTFVAAVSAYPLFIKGRAWLRSGRLVPPAFSVREWMLVSAILLQLGIVAVEAMGRPLLIWDSWVTWGMKARLIHQNGGVSHAVHADASRAVTHLDYPLLLPIAEAWVYGWLGVVDDRLVGVVVVGFYAALMAISYLALLRWGASRTVALVGVFAATSGNYVASLAGSVFADVPLAVYVAIATIYAVEALQGRPGATLVAAGSAGLLGWTKREGLVFVPVLVLAILWVGTRTSTVTHAFRIALALVLGTLVLAGPWWVFVSMTGVRNSDFLPVSGTTLVAGVDRLPTIARMVAATLLTGDWNAVWPLTLTLVLTLWWRGAHVRPAELLPLAAAAYLGLASTAYVVSAFVPYEAHIASSAFRLAAHVAPLLMIWIAWRSTPSTGIDSSQHAP